MSRESHQEFSYDNRGNSKKIEIEFLCDSRLDCKMDLANKIYSKLCFLEFLSKLLFFTHHGMPFTASTTKPK